MFFDLLLLWVPYPIRTLAIMVLHTALFLVLQSNSTSLNPVHLLRLEIYVSRGLPLLLLPSIFPATARCSIFSFLIICPKKLSCL